MTDKTKNMILIYTEQTPNPETLKFVSNRILYDGVADFKDAEMAEKWSPLAQKLFDLPYVKQVYISKNHVAVTKEMTFSWSDIMLHLKDAIKKHLEADGKVVNEGYAEEVEKVERERRAKQFEGDDGAIAKRIVELLSEYVNPGVAADGGRIEFVSYKDGVVTVDLQGACAGCPSSTVTLKQGVEELLTRMIPQVKEVVEYNDLLMGPVY